MREKGVGERRSCRCSWRWKAASIFNASHDKALCVYMCACVSVRVSVSNCQFQSDKKALRDEGKAWLFSGAVKVSKKNMCGNFLFTHTHRTTEGCACVSVCSKLDDC